MLHMTHIKLNYVTEKLVPEAFLANSSVRLRVIFKND